MIAGAIAFVCAILVLAEIIPAARLALTPSAGPLGARLILAALFALAIAAAVAWIVVAERREAAARAAGDAPFGGGEKVTAIAEAINLGYNLARDLREWRTGKAAPDEAGTGVDGEAPARAADAAASVRDKP